MAWIRVRSFADNFELNSEIPDIPGHPWGDAQPPEVRQGPPWVERPARVPWVSLNPVGEESAQRDSDHPESGI